MMGWCGTIYIYKKNSNKYGIKDLSGFLDLEPEFIFCTYPRMKIIVKIKNVHHGTVL
jgi:hypothetical protein